MTGFQVALESLTHDAKRWYAVSDTLEAAARSAAHLTPDAATFSFAGQSVAAEYEALRSMVQNYLQAGGQKTERAAQALREVRETYERSDDEAGRRIREAWSYE